MSGIVWMPIEDAPKDGTFVLLKGGITSEYDYLEEGVDINRPVVACYKSDWVFCYWDGAWRESYDNPTHFAYI